MAKGKGNRGSGEKSVGEVVKVINMSDNTYFCAQTGAPLPHHGFVFRYKDNLFSSRMAMNGWIANNE